MEVVEVRIKKRQIQSIDPGRRSCTGEIVTSGKGCGIKHSRVRNLPGGGGLSLGRSLDERIRS